MQKHAIQKLPEDLINQIKAGEVVERPASVVKELVENAIDAQASSVCVELLDGGKQLISITDNGIGIAAGELSLALERHATSKLQKFADLQSMKSFGFRGEALPSIAAVSEFFIKSRPQDQEMGVEIHVSQGHKAAQKSVPMPQGTSIRIKELFAGVPARLKFLKSTSTEYAHIHDFLVSMAFFYPHISFRLQHNGREAFFYQATDTPSQRLSDIVGANAKHYAPLSFERGSFRLSGWALLPQYATAIPQYFYTFVNGRLVKDKIVRAGLLQGYQGLLLKGLVPSILAHIETDPSWVDVNVHPAKTEVRFLDPLVAQDLMSMGVQSSLKKTIHKALSFTPPPAPVANHQDNEQPSSSPMRTPPDTPRPAPTGTHRPILAEPVRPTLYGGASAPLSQAPSSGWGKAPPTPDDNIKRRPHVAQLKYNAPSPVSAFSQAKYLGQYSNCYLILEKDGALWIVDQHAFHERILFEEYVAEYSKKELPRQQLLTPILVSSTACISEIVGGHAEKIRHLGFDVEVLANHNLALHSYPAFLAPEKIPKTFDDVVAKVLLIAGIPVVDVHPLVERSKQLARENEGTLTPSLEHTSFYHLFYATLACHNAVRAGDPLDSVLVERLLQRSAQVDFFAHCPHGRPVIRQFSLKDVESWFLRI